MWYGMRDECFDKQMNKCQSHVLLLFIFHRCVASSLALSLSFRYRYVFAFTFDDTNCVVEILFESLFLFSCRSSFVSKCRRLKVTKGISMFVNLIFVYSLCVSNMVFQQYVHPSSDSLSKKMKKKPLIEVFEPFWWNKSQLSDLMKCRRTNNKPKSKCAYFSHFISFKYIAWQTIKETHIWYVCVCAFFLQLMWLPYNWHINPLTFDRSNEKQILNRMRTAEFDWLRFDGISSNFVTFHEH